MTTASVDGLAARWRELLGREPKLRIRDAAARLGVSEAELVATRAGDGAARLEPDWPGLLGDLPRLRRVMALSRNDHAVHERKGTYAPASLRGPMGTVVGPDIDLRLFLSAWHVAFAVEEPGPHGVRRSLQVFDRQGAAVHKVYAEAETDAAAWDDLVARRRAADPAAPLALSPAPAAPRERPDGEVDVEGFRAAWLALRDTHDFYPMLGRFGVSRTQALRLAPPGHAVPLRVDRDPAGTLLRAAAEQGVPIMVFVGNPGILQIHTGPVARIVDTPPWVNVLDPDFNLHLRRDGIASAWRVVKPTADGDVTAIEVYDAAGAQVVQFFGARKPGKPELEGWRRIAGALG